MLTYYNENDPYAAQWLRNLIAAELIAPGDVDERSIKDVRGNDLKGYTQCHFFAGIGGWSYALRLAGWPDERPVWTGSCPCQPFSIAGKRGGDADDRHLWPDFKTLIAQQKPSSVFGEQVARGGGKKWIEQIATEFEDMDYAFGAANLCSSAFGVGQERERFFFVADLIGATATGGYPPLGREWREAEVAAYRQYPDRRSCCEVGMLDDGLPPSLAKRITRGFGNAIVPQCAAAFIEAFMECRPSP